MSTNVGEMPSQSVQRDLLADQRRAMLGSLTGIMAHEYNNLMTPVLARAQDAVSRDDVAAMRKALTTTLAQTEKALHFTRQVMELAQGREGPAESCRVVDLVDATITSAVRPFAKDGIELELVVPDDLYIRAQPLLFEQALLNLLLNARAAMKGLCGRLSISASRQGETVDIAVRDSGTGISPEMLDDVVNPFLAAAADTSPGDWTGVGLGLVACRLIAQQHGARITAQANDGPGCTFRLGWPAA
jgi:signal transduction histidine kinase